MWYSIWGIKVEGLDGYKAGNESRRGGGEGFIAIIVDVNITIAIIVTNTLTHHPSTLALLSTLPVPLAERRWWTRTSGSKSRRFAWTWRGNCKPLIPLSPPNYHHLHRPSTS